MEQIFYICKHCGNIIAKVKDRGVEVVCCGEKMQRILPNTVDASQEKHLPNYKVVGNVVSVSVGEIEHPMQNEHFIEWVSLQTDKGNQRKLLNLNQSPKVEFYISENEKIEAIYSYCNLHGLWKA